MEARLVVPCRLQEGEGAHEVGLDEGGGVSQRVVVVGLGREVDDDVGLGHERVDDVGVGDVPDDQRDTVIQVGQRALVPGVGELVQDGDGGARVTHQGLVDEVGADEAGASGDEDVHRTRSDMWELRALKARHGRRHHATGARSSPREPGSVPSVLCWHPAAQFVRGGEIRLQRLHQRLGRTLIYQEKMRSVSRSGRLRARPDVRRLRFYQ